MVNPTTTDLKPMNITEGSAQETGEEGEVVVNPTTTDLKPMNITEGSAQA